MCVCTIFNKVNKETFFKNLTLEKSHKKIWVRALYCREKVQRL